KALLIIPTGGLNEELARALILPDAGEEGARKAMEIYERAIISADPFMQLYSRYIPLLLGHVEQARKDALQLRATGYITPQWRHFGNFILDYHCGLISDEQLLSAAGKSNLIRCDVTFNIGLRHLSEGDRQTAKEYFKECRSTRLWDWPEYQLSGAFLNRLEKDPMCPRWIPPRPPLSTSRPTQH